MYQSNSSIVLGGGRPPILWERKAEQYLRETVGGLRALTIEGTKIGRPGGIFSHGSHILSFVGSFLDTKVSSVI